MDFDAARFNMVEQQIRPWDVLDPLVLDVFSTLQRELFVPDEYQRLAFSDTAIDIGHGQSTLPPKLEARLAQALDIESTDRILEIGTGRGFLTAVLATLGAHVTSIEMFEPLATAAKENLGRAGITNATLHVGDGIDGWTTAAPYDVIVLGGSLASRRASIEQQLSRNGRMFVVLGGPPVMEAVIIRRIDDNTWVQESLFETEVPPLIGGEAKQSFEF